MRAGLAGELDGAEALLACAREMRRRGYTRLDAHSPFPVPGLEEALAMRRSRLPWVAFAAGLGGLAVAYLIQWWTAAVDYPLDVGGRPAHAAPAYVPICFETMVLFAASVAFFGFFVAARLPALWQPVDEVDGFSRASIDRFFLTVDDRDRRFDPVATAADLEAAGATRVAPVGALPGRPR
jgi:hypothetical protein